MGKIRAKFGQKPLFLMFKMLKIQKISGAAPLDPLAPFSAPYPSYICSGTAPLRQPFDDVRQKTAIVGHHVRQKMFRYFWACSVFVTTVLVSRVNEPIGTFNIDHALKGP